MNGKANLQTMYWQDNCLYLLEQRSLPLKAEYRCCQTCFEVEDAIKKMSVRGAPAIGIAAAYGVALAAREAVVKEFNDIDTFTFLKEAATKLTSTRPTAVNLSWAVQRMEKVWTENRETDPGTLFQILLEEAKQIHGEDIENNRRIGFNGAELVPQKSSILTHCNAGALATGGYGTALGVVRAADEQGKDVHVFVDETRPLLQGARITAFELLADDISVTLITDNSAGHLMATGKVDIIVVGADRVAANGDVANKIGTYSLAVLAQYHHIPFYVAAPVSTIDMSIENGADIAIEKRSDREITHLEGCATAPEGITAYNPAFDITPARLVTAIITERGVVFEPDRDRLSKLF